MIAAHGRFGVMVWRKQLLRRVQYTAASSAIINGMRAMKMGNRLVERAKVGVKEREKGVKGDNICRKLNYRIHVYDKDLSVMLIKVLR